MQQETLPGVVGRGPEPRATAGGPGEPAGRQLPWLGIVAGLFVAAQLVLVVPGLGLGWDETVYVSQVGRHAPAAFFSAPRARGISFLVAPIAGLTTSVVALRCYLAVLSGGALLLGLRLWRRLLPAPVLALAGGLFASLWITLFYGPQAMPNLWVALAALAAVGCFLRAVRDGGDRVAVYGTGCATAVAALMRPTDAVWLALPLVAAVLVVRPWRRPAVLLALVVGSCAGAAEWVVEAYLSYGGLVARLARASEIQGGLGLHPAFGHQLRALDGRSLCRPCDVPWRDPASAVWWLALPLLVAGGVLAAARLRMTAVVVMPTLTGLSQAVPYLLTIDYAAPRFLLPAYVLLSLPAALFLIHTVTSVRPRLRSPVAAVVVAVLVAHTVTQVSVLGGVVARGGAAATSLSRVATNLRDLGVRPPCTVSGVEAARVGFLTGCASRQVAGHDGSISRDGLLDLARRRPVAILVAAGRPAPAYVRGWRAERMRTGAGRPELHAYLSPTTGSR